MNLADAMPKNGVCAAAGPTRERTGVPLGACLVDAQSRICAADPAVTAWLADGLGAADIGPWGLELLAAEPALDEALKRCLAGVPTGPIVASIPSCGISYPPVSIEFTRLEGTLGPHVLLSFYGAPQESSPLPLDALTELPDRRAVADRATAWRHSSAGELARFAVLFVDLDHFKAVNDSFGHAVGDAVLRTVASRLVHCIREGDLATRYGGDEFVLLIRGAATADEVEPVLRRLDSAMRTPVSVGEIVLKLSATIGWSTPTSPDWTIDELVAAADADMYARKRRMLR